MGTFCRRLWVSHDRMHPQYQIFIKEKTFDTLLHQYLWTLHSIMRLDMISNHGRGSPQRSITSEISISIIKHVQIIIITIICIFCKGCNKACYRHQHRRQYILADFSGNCSCQFARDTWMAGASNEFKDVIWCQCSCIWKALCQQSFVLYVCFPTQFSWTHWWRVWEQCRFSVVHLIMAAFYIFKKRSWCWWGWTKFMGWSYSSTSFVGLDFLPSFCKCSAPFNMFTMICCD